MTKTFFSVQIWYCLVSWILISMKVFSPGFSSSGAPNFEIWQKAWNSKIFGTDYKQRYWTTWDVSHDKKIFIKPFSHPHIVIKPNILGQLPKKRTMKILKKSIESSKMTKTFFYLNFTQLGVHVTKWTKCVRESSLSQNVNKLKILGLKSLFFEQKEFSFFP